MKRIATDRRWLAWGFAVAGLVLAASLLVQHGVPVRILFDGVVPPLPYRWVRPPASLAATNELPLPAEGDIPLTATGSEARSVPTGDGQAIVIFAKDGVAPREGESLLRVTVIPLDPGTLPPAPPARRIDGNAYRIEAVYASSGRPAVLRKPITVDLRYPIHAEEMLRLSSSAWTTLPTTRFDPSLTLVAFSDQLGTFVMVGPAGARPMFTSWWPYLATVAVLLAAVAALLLVRRPERQGPRLPHEQGRRGTG